ncbi:fibrocystin isoform X5 [Grus americana]|uniref:fibrocystin isoform X5 n=1 Tax=Grus americana TaxID=9117 RepID=UPI002407930B|nr:fibrocystin isoform X5 [Grus americana]
MKPWRSSLLSAELIFFAVTATGLLIKPQEGSVAGGTWITITLDGSTSHQLEQVSSASGSQLEVSLVNPDLPRLPCDVYPVYFDLSTIRCRTRSSPQEGLYYVEVIFKGHVINNLTEVEKENYTFKFSAVQTPVVYQINPPSGIPGHLIEIHGKTIAGRYETLDFNVDYIDGPAILMAEDGWTSLCSFADRRAGSIYPIRVEDGLGTLQCRVEGNHIGSHNVSFSVFNKGKSAVHKGAWLISAKQELFLYQTHSEIASVFPAGGSLGGGTDLTVVGDFFEEPVQVTAAGVPCKVKHVSPQQIRCTTEPVGKGRRLGAPQPGNRGLLFEVWDDASDLTEAGPGYRWQFVPNASSPVRFLSGAKKSFSSRLRGFFVAPQTNNYTFWIQADGQASLYLSLSQDPEHKVRIASLPAGNSEWSENWVKSWSERWQPKSQKFELTAGSRYYLEALHHGKAPSNGMRVGVQIHNTWLNPHVVNNYYIERHEIRAHALRLPEVQMLTVTGTGCFSISWNNILHRMIPTNATAHQVQTAIEELLSIGCETEPSSAKILFRDGFEKEDMKDFISAERVVSGTEPFCGRFSIRRPSQLVNASPSTLPRYDLTKYTHVCFAHKGHMSNVFHISVTYTNVSLYSVKRNFTCLWDFNESDSKSWTFTCTDLWKGCVNLSTLLQDLPANTPVFVHQIDLLSPVLHKETSGSFYLDEVIIADRAVTVSQRHPKPPWPGGRIVEAVSVVGSSPTYNVSWMVSGCGASLPLLSPRGALLAEGSKEYGLLYISTEDVRVSLTIQRLQKSSPPIGGTFRIHLANTVISDVSVHISAHHLRKLLQDNVDNSTAPYFNTSDFIVTKDSNSCYESIWTLTWKTKTGDLPNVINVSAENLTGLKPTVSSRVVYDGGVFIGPIFGDMLATFNNKTQVVAVVNDILANCSGSCSFQFSQELTPLVSDVEYSSDDGSQATVVIRGAGFTEKPALQVEVSNKTCHVITLNQTEVVCQMERLPVGVYQVALLVRPYGFALNGSTGEGIFLRVEAKLVAIEPPTASEIGGLRVALRGTNLERVNLVLFGSQPCPVLEDDRTSTRIECKVPSRGTEDAAVAVTLISGYQSTTVTNLFQYDPSLNPAVVSLSRNRSGIAGGQELQIGISQFASYRGSDIKVQIGGSWAQIQVQTDRGVNVTLPALAAGWYNVSVLINGITVASNRVEPLIQYISEIFSVEPCCGSFLGGTLLTISGVGFSQNPALVSVSMNRQTCMVTHLAEETVWCLTPPAANLSNEESQDISVEVNVVISSRSLQHTLFAKRTTTFNYQRALTPLITVVEMEITDSSLLLSIQGINITGSVAKLGHSECELNFQHGNTSAMFYQCSLPLNSLEPGTFPIQVIQKQLGYARVTARLQALVITPQITSIFPSQGSVCGGMLLTISGIALKSRRNLVQVSLEGNYSCEIQNSDNDAISCIILPRARPLHYQWLAETSWALNVTVTVNGISSVCLGDCTLHLHEQWTPLVDVVTWETNGTFTYVMIKGQRLAWPSDSPMVHVNNQAVCKVTFWNETSINCQTKCIAPGEHNISISNRKSGQACFRKVSSVFTILPQVYEFYPQNFSTNGGGLLTLSGSALKGKRMTSVLIDHHPCLVLSVTCVAIQCTVPPGNGTRALTLKVDGISYYLGRIYYNKEFTPAFLSLVATGLLLTMTVSQVTEMDTIYVFVGDFTCSGVTITCSTLQCSAPLLPVGEYHVMGLDVPRGWASSNLTFVSQLTVTAVHYNWGDLNGGPVYLHGTGFSPGKTLVTVCGVHCELLGNMTTTDLSCLAPRLHASLTILCGLTHSSVDCREGRATFIECDVEVTVGSYRQRGSVSYLYICEDSQLQGHWRDMNPPQRHFAGLFVSPKVERDEVLIYNSSCNITMETEAEMECEGANQPITAKITEIWKNWGQNTQLALQFCGRWDEDSSWPAGHQPQDGDNVTIDEGRTLLLGTTTTTLNLLHLKGGKLLFTGPGPVELHAHYILISDGGELQVGSPEAPFRHKAHIYLYGSLHSPPLFPYGVKFLAVRNGTLSLHGWMPKVAFTDLKSSARANDTRLMLLEPVDWQPGDEIVVGRTGLGDAQQQEEMAVIESVNNTELHLKSPLRYSHNVEEGWVNGQSLPLRAVVALISRRVVVQGNVTMERMSHLRQCVKAGVTRGGSRCLYKRSERQLGSRDLGAIVVVEAFQGETSRLQMEGVQFHHVGQAFQQHRSALTVAGNAWMADSYIRGCCVLDSFGQGLRLTGISNLTVDSNVFYNISGHGLLLGEGLEEGNRVSNNIVIGLSGTDGLSNIETLSPAGIYIRAPANHIKGNTVSAAGYGYFFHLSPEGPSKIPLLSFSENIAHSCQRYGLLVYPEYLPESPNRPVRFNNFTAWSSQGGAQIFRSSNLELQHFWIYACKDFGIDMVESLGNTSVADSVLIGHIGQKDRTCMSAGLKTPKRYQLFISNTAFRNFDENTCTAIRTCSGCYQGQGGFTVRAEHLTFINSPFQVSFPFPHSAILEDIDGSVTGQRGSHLLPSTDILVASCTASANFSQASGGSVCGSDLVFHRMSVHLKEAPDIPYNLTVTDSRNKTTTVNYVPDTLSNLYGWMVLLLDKETYALTFDNPLVSKQLQYSVTFSNFTPGNYLLVEHKDLPAHPEVVVSCGTRTGQPLQSLPSYGYHRSCDWYLDSRLRTLTYLVTGADLIQVTLKEKERVALPNPVPSDVVLKWSHPETWNDVEKGWGGSNHSIPGPGEDVIILPNRTILVDTALPPLRGLYILGTLEFPSNSSNVLSAACIVVVGGALKVGSFQHPLERDLKLLVLLRASEGIYCDRLEEINVHPGSIGVYGKVQIYSTYPKISWTHLGTNVAPGNERIFVEDEVDWNHGGDIVISSSSYEAHQAEVVTLKEVNGHSIRIHERLLYRHIGHSHDTEDGRHIPLAAEVGLLTRNVQIKSDVACAGRTLVGRFTDSSGTEFEEVTFTGFTKSCYSEDRDVCIMSNADHLGIMPLITAERSRMLHVYEKDKFYFHSTSVQTSEDTTFPEKTCRGSRKALFKDLDGGVLDLEPPVSVFPKSEFEWTQFYLQAGIYGDDSKCIFKPSVQGYFCKQADHALVILEILDPSTVSQRLFPVVSVTGNFMDTFSDMTSHASCYPAEHRSTFFSVLPSTKLTTICFPDLAPLTFRLYLLSGQNATRLPLAIFYNEPLSLRVFLQGKYVSPTPSSFSLSEGAGANYFSFEDNLLYVLLHEKEPVEIVTGLSFLVAFTVTEAVGEEIEASTIHRLADFLKVGHDQVRIVHHVLGGESMLKVISANDNKKKYHCPNMAFCTAFHSRSSSQKVERGSVSTRALQPSDMATPSRVLIIELGDPPGHPRNELTSDNLKSLARTIINTHQTGDLQRGLGLSVDTLMVTQPALLFPAEANKRNGSRKHPGTCLYVRPYNISVQVQPSDGEIEKQLPVQPKIVFLDRKGQRVDKLGPPSEPWIVSAHLNGSSEAVLKGLTQVQVIDGCASFSNLAVSSSGTNWKLGFTVTSPPGAKFTVLSQPFTISPVPMGVKASMILVVILSSAASAFILTLAFCWFKKSKSNKTRTERADVPKTSTKAPCKQAQPHAAHIQPCYNQGENKSGVPVGGDTEGTGAVGHATGQLEGLNLQLSEAKSTRKTSTVQCKTGNRDTFSSARNSDSHQQLHGGTTPGDSLELQQPTVSRSSSQKDVSQPSAGYKERQKSKRMPKPQNDVGEHVAVVAAEV